MRPEQPLYLNRKLHPEARVGWEQFFANGYVQHSAKHPQFLMDRCRLEAILLNDTTLRLNLNPSLKPLSKVLLDVIRGETSRLM
jgi:hypothetical protein